MNDRAELPPEFLSRLRKILEPRHVDPVLESFFQPKHTGFRVNTLKLEPSDLIPRLRTADIDPDPVTWCDEAFGVSVAQRSLLTHTPRVLTGDIYVQSLSSILAVTLLDVQPGQWNLDLAAAPGGKATHIAALMNNEGKLSVVEPIRKRMYRLADTLKRLGVTIGKTYLMDGRKVGEKVPDRFDRVLLDAPCSSESRIRGNDPESWKYWSQRKIREQARKQAGLIRSGFVSLKPGGIMLYCTCSFAPEENEAIVAGLLNEFPDQAQLLPLDLPIDNWQAGLREFGSDQFAPQLELTRRILPNSIFDGFYLALLAKE
ncbi:MAG: RsmB/NOP family class I SAM-dependent RNA methyltransferase [Pirellulaceae bacterium]